MPLLNKRPTGVQDMLWDEVRDVGIPRAEQYGRQKLKLLEWTFRKCNPAKNAPDTANRAIVQMYQHLHQNLLIAVERLAFLLLAK